jgi:hypothetical protein
MLEQRRPISFAKLMLIPGAFLLKDIIATMAILAQEPGISGRAVLYYTIALLPGTLFVVTGYAITVNLLIGLLISVTIYVVQRLRSSRLR